MPSLDALVSLPPVAPAEQVQFLIQLQRLLHEGSFTSTYKFALLLAIADVAVEEGNDSGDAMEISTHSLAARFVRLYWRQVLPYPSSDAAAFADAPDDMDTSAGILLQNTGRQAALVPLLHEFHAGVGGSLAKLQRLPSLWGRLLDRVANKIEEMPLWKLQMVGSKTRDFLYPNVKGKHAIELRPGVAFCFRQFHELVEDLVQGAWTRFLRELPANQPLLGQNTDLPSFLFGSERAGLAVYRPVLEEIQSGHCFYCQSVLKAGSAVDHFIPWSLYPVDLGHNFVLAHEGCNSKKSNRLAAYTHLARWVDRNASQDAMLAQMFTEIGVVHDIDASRRITGWAYSRADLTETLVWNDDRDALVALDPKWRALPGLAA